MDTDVLDLFVDTMRRRSFAAVARDRNLDPSSVSRAIAALEEELGVMLFHRSTRKLTPTEAGLLYATRMEPLLDEMRRARNQAIDLQERPQGHLRIHAPVSFGQMNVVPLLPQFSEKHPELTFELILNDRPLSLLDEHIDVALRTQPIAEKDCVVQPLARILSRVCASPGYLQKHGRPQAPLDLQHHRCLLLQMPGFQDVWRFRSAEGEVQHVPVQGPVRSSNALALRDLAVADMGIILQARWIVARALEQGQLMDLFPEFEVSGSDVEDPTLWLVYPTQAYLPLKVRVFLAFLQAQFQPVAPWDHSTA